MSVIDDGENPDGRAIIVAGNLSDGFRFIGPFDSFEEASLVAEGMDNEPTWIATLHAPEGDCRCERDRKRRGERQEEAKDE